MLEVSLVADQQQRHVAPAYRLDVAGPHRGGDGVGELERGAVAHAVDEHAHVALADGLLEVVRALVIVLWGKEFRIFF